MGLNLRQLKIDPDVFAKEYVAPVHRMGSITVGLHLVAMFIPPVALYLIYGLIPPWDGFIRGMLAAVAFAGPFFIIEPIAYYPVLGISGTYMSFTAGNISNLRLPCALVAQSALGVEEGSKQGELVATIAVAASVWLSITAVFIGAVAGGFLVARFPPWLIDAFRRFLLPSVFGAVFGQFALRGVAFAPFPLIVSYFAIRARQPVWVIISLSVFGTIIVGRIIYKMFMTRKEAPQS
jgi:hypothetical protein